MLASQNTKEKFERCAIKYLHDACSKAVKKHFLKLNGKQKYLREEQAMTLFEDLKPGDIFIHAKAVTSSEVRSPENSITALVKLDRPVFFIQGMMCPDQCRDDKCDTRGNNAVALFCGQPTHVEDDCPVIRLR